SPVQIRINERVESAESWAPWRCTLAHRRPFLGCGWSLELWVDTKKLKKCHQDFTGAVANVIVKDDMQLRPVEAVQPALEMTIVQARLEQSILVAFERFFKSAWRAVPIPLMKVLAG